MPRIRISSIIFAVLLASVACSKPPVAPPPSGTATPVPSVTIAAAAAAISEPEAALLHACEQGDLKTVKTLLDKGVNINVRDKDGRQPIIEASYWQHPDIVRLLIDKGADVNAKKLDGTTALGFAVILRNKEIEQMLRQAGAKADQSVAAETKQQAAGSPSPAAKTK